MGQENKTAKWKFDFPKVNFIVFIFDLYIFFPQSLNEGFLLKNQADCNVSWEASCSYLDQGATLSGPIRTWTLMNFG